MAVDPEDIDGELASETGGVLDYDEVVVVHLTGLWTHIMGASHDDGIVAERVDNDDLGVDHDHVELEGLMKPIHGGGGEVVRGDSFDRNLRLVCDAVFTRELDGRALAGRIGWCGSLGLVDDTMDIKTVVAEGLDVL